MVVRLAACNRPSPTNRCMKTSSSTSGAARMRFSSFNSCGVDLPWAKGDLTFDGETFKDVGIRYKGNYTFMATARSLKKSMKFDLNKYVEGQKLEG